MRKTFSIIKSRYYSLTNSEKKIADYLLMNESRTLLMTVSELANFCNVSEATVIRFVKKIGLKSFQELKLSLATDSVMNETSEIKEMTINKEDTPKIILNKIANGVVNAIESTKSILNIESVIQTANFLRSAKRIEIYGVGASFSVAKILSYKLSRLGYQAYALEDPHMQAISAAIMKSGDLVIGISQSGSTKDIVDSISVAKKHGATVICITDHIKSPIAKYSDVLLETYSQDNAVKTSAGRSIIAQIFVVEFLTGILSNMDYEKTLKAGKETAKAVVNKLY